MEEDIVVPVLCAVIYALEQWEEESQEGRDQEEPQQGRLEEPQEGRDQEEPQQGRLEEPQEGRHQEEPQQGRLEEPQEGRDQEEPQQGRLEEPQEGRDQEEPQEGRDQEEPQEGREQEEPQQGRLEEPQEGRDQEEPQEGRDQEEPQEGRDQEEPQEGREQEEPPVPVPRVRIRRSRQFWRAVPSFGELSDDEVLRMYPLSRAAILQVFDLVRWDLDPVTARSQALPGICKLLAVLHFLGSGSFQQVSAHLAGMSQPTFSRILTQVLRALLPHSQRLISFPSTEAEWTGVKQDFYLIGRFPNCLGAIDCTHVPLTPPRAHRERYRNRERSHSINVQVVCDSHLRIMSVRSGFPGSVHDAHILRQSALYERFTQGEMPRGWLVGDAGYGVLPWLMTPIRFPRTPAQRRYNRAHRKTHKVTQRLFGALKSRFRCLSVNGGALLYSPIKVSEIIIVCAMLHNVALQHGLPADIDDHLEPEIEGYVGRRWDNRQGRRVRNQLIASRFR
ncbi:putative nuclease HARBI1 [Xenopus tropicalis]|nr:putative nuclease HARBI1 [Xenopus tropicalis]